MNAPSPHVTAEEKLAKNVIRATTTIFGLLWLPSIALAMATLSMLQDLSVLSNRGYWFMVVSAMSMPVVIGFALIASRTIIKDREFKIAIVFSLLPCINIFFYLFGLVLSRG